MIFTRGCETAKNARAGSACTHHADWEGEVLHLCSYHWFRENPDPCAMHTTRSHGGVVGGWVGDEEFIRFVDVGVPGLTWEKVEAAIEEVHPRTHVSEEDMAETAAALKALLDSMT